MSNITTEEVILTDEVFCQSLKNDGISPSDIKEIPESTIDKINELTDGVEIDLDKPLKPERFRLPGRPDTPPPPPVKPVA